MSLDEATYFRASNAVYFSDVIFTLEERNLEITHLADLDGLSVVAFPDAARTYPKWLEASATTDRYIIRYLSLELSRESGVVLKPTRVSIFSEPWGYAPIFRSEQIRDDVTEGLRVLRERGRYDEIVAEYLK